LSKADLTHADLTNADLKGANLTGVNLTTSLNLGLESIRSSVLNDARLTRLDLRNANLSNASLAYADLSQTDLSYADLSGADLSHAILKQTDLRWANLVDAKLTGADATGATMMEADLGRADFQDANLDGVSFDAVKNFGKAKNLATARGLDQKWREAVAAVEMRDRKHGQEAAPAEPSRKNVRIWDLQVQKYGAVQVAFAERDNLASLYDGLTDLELNLLKHRMFSDGGQGVPAQDNTVLGVLYTVNFIPGNLEIPVEVVWVSPQQQILHRQKIITRYMEFQVATFPLSQAGDGLMGTWTAEFHFDGNRIGEQKINVVRSQANNGQETRETKRKPGGRG
jgi:hypothetical protein